jgi:serine/threonine-protein kinase HipA
MARTLNVFLGAAPVGRLEQDDSGALWFTYDPAWLSNDAAIPLSHSLPLSDTRYKRNECRPFFAGLLPEEDSRKLIAKTFGVSDRNDFAILENIGAECAGAVSIMPVGETPLQAGSRYREVSPADLEGLIATLPKRPLLVGEEGIRLSLAGAQGKIAVAIWDGRFSLPLDGSPSTHIIKPQSPHFKGLVENEFYCMKLASAVGLEVANVEMGTAVPTRFLQVERYDRRRLPDGKLERIHQEDFCQALGIPPELKYQQEGGPNFQMCFDLVREVSSVPGLDVLRLFDAVVFNCLIGNNDAHGKNFSFLRDADGIRLAPLYDLVCTGAYPDIANSMAMKIGGERDPARLAAKHWRRFFEDAGLGGTPAIKRLRGVALRVQQSNSALAQEYPDAGAVASLVSVNCQRLLGEGWKT